MKINQDLCIGCENCLKVCPMEAISSQGGQAQVNLEICVECGTCLRFADCPTEAIFMSELSWPRTLASILSDPVTEIKETQLAGRGTEEMKTNEITGRIKPGQVGFAVDVGRPHVGTTFADVEKICMELSKHDVIFETKNPVTLMMKDKNTGEMRDDVRSVRVLTAVIECLAPAGKTVEVLKALQRVSKEIDTVFSLNLIGLMSDTHTVPLLDKIQEAGLQAAPNGKVNLGLGRADQ